MPCLGGDRFGHDEYTHYYYAQAIYILGDDGYAKLFPDTKAERAPDLDQVQDATFENLMQHAGAATATGTAATSARSSSPSVYLTILQLDNGVLPIYQR